MKRRKIIAAIVLLGGVALFFIIIVASPSSSRPLIVAEAGKGTDGSLDYAASANRGAAGETTGGGQVNGGNLTDLLTQGYAQTILQMNNGFAGASATSANPISFPSVDTTSQLVAQAINQQIAYKTYTLKDIAISDDTSTSSQLQYLAAVGAITKKDFGSFNMTINQMVSNTINNNDSSALDQYITIAQNEVTDLLAVTVPSNWAAWHLADINLWEEKITVFSAIADFTNDPVRAISGLNQVSDVLGKNDVLNGTLKDKYDTLTS